MVDNKARLRGAEPTDAAALLAIYAPYVENTAITFEYLAPSVEEFQKRIAGTLEKYPYIVAESGGEILGYAYTGRFHSRAAYAWSAETTVYLAGNRRGKGLGGRLYRALEELSRRQGILNLNACIASPEVEDGYLTANSIGFHRHLGYRMVGEFHKCGYKFGRWYNMVWMEKALGNHPDVPAPVKPFGQLCVDWEKF